MQSITIFLTILFFLAMLFLTLMLSFFMQSKALKSLVRAFRRQKAFNAARAVGAADLGISKQHILFRKRDYKPQMLQFLISAGVVQATEDQRFFFSEEKLVALREGTTKLGRLFLPE